MSVGDLSTSTQNYLKGIWALSEWSDTPVTPSSVAKHLGLRKSTVSDGVRKLGEQGLVEHKPYGAVELTDTGRTYAVAMIRRHRLIDRSFFVVIYFVVVVVCSISVLDCLGSNLSVAD